MAIIKK